MTRCQVGL